ncbi:UTRA domain-containing protein [Vibrio breoganii]|uniref:UTRA domain-containing protein n=1 Tax=Vibrio breoganii TaxID=553239 RepID=A0ABX1U744_9VIBR|nr:UTRA domain-containing protein [Vibrio breoganii]NMR69064.1 UTRA domain-containing protein [Vibrio breoganii]TKG23401.1 UTRA domain-containing protein [Vibrio breoganii]TKG29985.1 UTRA domain-containing protein [Vibrio breoganii]
MPVLPQQDIADLLNIDAALPIIEKRTRGHLHDDTVFEYSRNYFTTNDYKFKLIAKRQRP